MPLLIPTNTDTLEDLVIQLATLYDQGEECVDFDGNVVSDPDYDALVKELRKRRPDSKAFEGTSPSTFVPTGNLVIHNPPMTSIAKADGEDKVDIYNDWIKDCCTKLGYTYPPEKGKFVQSYKHDGVAIRLYYEKGKLVRAGLRPRDGVKGIDVTANVQHVKGVLMTLPLPLTLAIGGELECRLPDFQKVQDALAKAGEDLRKNPRNHTYGGINQQKDPSKTADARISFMGYNITGFDDSAKYYETEMERAKWVNKVLKVPFVQVRDHHFDDLKKMEDGVPDLEFEVDGVVLKVNNLEDQEQLGHHGDTPTGEPRGALAWKFAEEVKVAEVDHVEWNASRTGRVTPVAVFKKGIQLAGTTVMRATCSNAGWLRRMGIGKDSSVKVIKAGKIIPKVIEVVAGKTSEAVPGNCPACSQRLQLVDGSDGNQDLMCHNAGCSAKMVRGIVFYLTNLDCKGLGESKVEQIIQHGKLKGLADLYRLTEKDLLDCGYSTREAQLALCAIHHVKPVKDDVKLAMAILTAKGAKKTYPAWQFFAALGIPRAGKTVGKLLVEKGYTFDQIRKLTKDELLGIAGIGDTVATSVFNYFQANCAEIDDLLQYIDFEKPKTGKLSGITFVLSGSFDDGKSHWENLIQEQGGKIGSSVGSKTNYLVAGPGSGSKSDKAKELGITILDVEELKKMLA
jgi:DNA ligase (NAD+)